MHIPSLLVTAVLFLVSRGAFACDTGSLALMTSTGPACIVRSTMSVVTPTGYKLTYSEPKRVPEAICFTVDGDNGSAVGVFDDPIHIDPSRFAANEVLVIEKNTCPASKYSTLGVQKIIKFEYEGRQRTAVVGRIFRWTYDLPFGPLFDVWQRTGLWTLGREGHTP